MRVLSAGRAVRPPGQARRPDPYRSARARERSSSSVWASATRLLLASTVGTVKLAASMLACRDMETRKKMMKDAGQIVAVGRVERIERREARSGVWLVHYWLNASALYHGANCAQDNPSFPAQRARSTASSYAASARTPPTRLPCAPPPATPSAACVRACACARARWRWHLPDLGTEARARPHPAEEDDAIFEVLRRSLALAVISAVVLCPGASRARGVAAAAARRSLFRKTATALGCRIARLAVDTGGASCAATARRAADAVTSPPAASTSPLTAPAAAALTRRSWRRRPRQSRPPPRPRHQQERCRG